MRAQLSSLGLVQRYILPIFIILALPGFSLWFFHYATGHFDARIRESIMQSIRLDAKAKSAEREEAERFFNEHPVSQILVSDDAEIALLKAKFDSVADRYAFFRAMITLSWACLGTAVATVLLVCLSIFISLHSQAVQFWTLAFTWHVLKLLATVQLLGQGVLAVSLSYWISVITFNRYYPQLIFAVGLLVLAAVCAIFKAMFKKLDHTFTVEGEILDPARARQLWARISSLAAALGTREPDQIVVGIDDNFFVTEHVVTVNEKSCSGRTLYVSLPLLETLEREEAEAVLTHELAHFSGQDTLYSRRTAPILMRYDEYLRALGESPVALPVFYFMLGFRSLFELSLSRTRRSRELRADALAVQNTSPRAFTNALLKIGAYSAYRQRLEVGLFAQDGVMESAEIASGIAAGLPAFVNDGLSLEDLGDACTAHPFDSHPPLRERMEAVGISIEREQRKEVLLADVQSSWHADIEGVEELEGALWSAYENKFRKAHERSLAFRYLPASDVEREVVERYFPARQFKASSGDEEVIIDHAGISASSWPQAVGFHQVVKCTTEERLGRLAILKIVYRPEESKSQSVVQIDFRPLHGSFLDEFARYWGRFEAARDYQAQLAEEQATKQVAP